MNLHSTIFILVILLLPMTVSAAQDIYVVGLFKDRAVLMIDGKRRVLSAGKTGPGGVRLISASSEAAIIEVDGHRRRLTPELRLSTSFAPPALAEVRIAPDPLGMYRTDGRINGQPVSFMVDTGATRVAMNANQARRLGIDFRNVGIQSMVSTASGYETVYQVKLKSVRIGAINLLNVDAAVLDGDHPAEVLLGMSFLGRLNMENTDGRLVLRKKF